MSDYQQPQGNDGWSESSGALNPTWDFERNPTVTGEYVEYKREVGVNKSDIVVLAVQTPEGIANYGVWCNARLKTLMSNPEIRLNMLVSITRLGRKQGKTPGRSYWDFKVMFRHKPNDVSFTPPPPQPQYQQPPVANPYPQPQQPYPNYPPPAAPPQYPPQYPPQQPAPAPMPQPVVNPQPQPYPQYPQQPQPNFQVPQQPQPQPQPPAPPVPPPSDANTPPF